MEILHERIASLCNGRDLQKGNQHLKELYSIMLASEQYLGEISPEYKREVLDTIQLADDFTELLSDVYVQEFLRGQLKAVS